MSKRGLPTTIKMRHNSHYVEDLARTHLTIGKVIPINKIKPNPEQPRVEIGDLSELSGSIKENGVLEPLLVKPKDDGTWMIIAGERRWRAANLAGLVEVPCIELDIDDKTVAEIALIENLQRKDLTIWEEADGFAYLRERFGYTHDDIAKKIGKSRTTVTESMAIAGLPEPIRKKCRQANINAKSNLLEIARQFDEQAMHGFIDNIKKVGKDAFNSTKSRQLSDSTIKRSENNIIQKKDYQSSPNQNNNVFLHKSKNNDFILEIRFNKQKNERSEILQALKEVFDSVKNNS